VSISNCCQQQIYFLSTLPPILLPSGKSNMQCNYKLPPKLQKKIIDRGINQLYSHQAEAINTIFNGSSIVPATPTGSEKSMTGT
jgi:ATP-dependent helicase YprA (DUF1998 family)